MISSALLLLLAAAENQPGLAVMDFAIEGAPPEIAAATSSLVAHELERLQLFKITTAETTRVILGVERQRALLGCENCSGNAIDELTSFEYLVTGKLVRSGGAKDSRYVLQLTLMKAKSAQPLSSVRIEARGEEKLLQEVAPGTLKLVGKLLEGRQGSLVVGASETGASVKIDDTQVGTTPLQSRLAIAAGPHLLSVEKDGFTQVRKEVRISPDQVSDEFIRLVPSPDMAEAYEAKAKRFRVLAWVSTGVAVAGLGAFVGGNIYATALYGETNTDKTFAFYRNELVKGDESYRDMANQLKSQIELWQTISWVGLGAAGAGAIAATVFFVIGDPPGKYEAYRQKTGVVSMSVSPTPGGVVVSGQF